MSVEKKSDDLELQKKAMDFWNSELKDIEPDDLMSFSILELDSRVPHQGSVILDRIYRPKQ